MILFHNWNYGINCWLVRRRDIREEDGYDEYIKKRESGYKEYEEDDIIKSSRWYFNDNLISSESEERFICFKCSY